jgi:hypothetical protein
MSAVRPKPSSRSGNSRYRLGPMSYAGAGILRRSLIAWLWIVVPAMAHSMIAQPSMSVDAAGS